MESLNTISQPKSLAKIANEKLRTSILNGELAAGELYTEMSLAKEMGISRTPVREALLELASKGIVEFLPRRGIMVRLISEKDVNELFELREILERYFFKKIASTPSQYDFTGLENSIREQRKARSEKDVPAYLKANGDFHYKLAEMCDNKRMQDTYGDLVDVICLIALQGKNSIKMDYLIEQHESMLKALKAGEGNLADALLIIHLKESKQTAIKMAVSNTSGDMQESAH
ncbi:MAG: GntR family transcriptional regulator [Desulfobacterales bacterium]|nr:GntR family transcriptional regulator [Desulfobacterales bacterium]